MGSKERTWAAAAVLDLGDKANGLLQYLGGKSRDDYKRALSRYNELSPEDVKKKAGADLKSLISSREFTGIAEVHPGWIWEALRDETPRVISIVLRYLPSHHTKYVLEFMPADIRNQLPAPIEAFRAPPEYVAIIREIFQRKFLPMFMPRRIGTWSLEHLPYMKEKDLNEFFEERGLTELALAISDMPHSAQKVVMNRLTLEQATNLKEYIESYAVEFESLKRIARFTVLEIETTEHGGSEFLRHLGMKSTSRAVEVDDKWIALTKQRLEPKEGYLWQRFVDETITGRINFDKNEKKMTEKILRNIMNSESKEDSKEQSSGGQSE